MRDRNEEVRFLDASLDQNRAIDAAAVNQRELRSVLDRELQALIEGRCSHFGEVDADDDGNGLCGPDSTCIDGGCSDDPGQPAGVVTGCGCSLEGGNSSGASVASTMMIDEPS